MNKVIISGWYGIPNVGAESILTEHVNFFKQKNSKITVLSWNPEFTKKTYDVRSKSQFSLLDVKNEIKKCDSFVLGGGDVIDDITRGLVFWMSKPWLASILKKKVIFSTVGVKHLNYEISKKILKCMLKKCDLITVRDKYSFYMLRKLSDNKKLHLVSDSSFLLPKRYTPDVNKIIKKGKFKKKLIVSLCSSFQQKLIWSKFKIFNERKILDIFPKLLDKLVRTYDLEVIFLPMQVSDIGDDRILYFQIMNAMENRENVKIVNNILSPEESKAVFSSGDVTLSMRFHSSIFSTSSYIPTVGIGYDFSPRIENYYNELNLHKFFININNLTPQKLFNLIELSLIEKRRIKAILERKIKIFTDKAKYNFNLIENTLNL